MEIEIKSLTPDLLNDYLFFFDNMVFSENPDWSKCYCYSFHFTGTSGQWNKDSNRAAVISMINDSTLKGYLAYSDDKPIGWCNANDRKNFQALDRYYDVDDKEPDLVCSIVCFLISPDHRRQGIAQKFLSQVNEDYSSQGYDYLEAYPGKGDLSCEKHYKGPLSLYKKLGFKTYKEFKDYLVVRKYLENQT
ncbi:GNAT family N-acetyltransferase [Bacteroidota bacterium]